MGERPKDHPVNAEATSIAEDEGLADFKFSAIGRSIWSWEGIGWLIAALLGLWGILLAAGDYTWADFVFVTCALLFCAKWTNVTKVYRKRRNTFPFAVGLIITSGMVTSALLWTNVQAKQAASQEERLSQLNLIPTLQGQVRDLNGQLKDVPGLKAQLENLRQENTANNVQVSKKQLAVEGLTQVVINQNKQLTGQTAQIAKLQDEGIQATTGGTGWAYLDFGLWASPDGRVDRMMRTVGDYPQYDVSASIYDVNKLVAIAAEIWNREHRLLSSSREEEPAHSSMVFGNLPKHVIIPVAPIFITGDRQDFNVRVVARNGIIDEVVRCVKTAGNSPTWLIATRVTRRDDSGKDVVLMEDALPDFPKNPSGKIDWDTSIKGPWLKPDAQ